MLSCERCLPYMPVFRFIWNRRRWFYGTGFILLLVYKGYRYRKDKPKVSFVIPEPPPNDEQISTNKEEDQPTPEPNILSQPLKGEKATTDVFIPYLIYEDPQMKPVLLQFFQKVRTETDLDNLYIIKETGSEIHNGHVLLPCIVSSRIGSDLQSAFEKASLAHDAPPPIVLFFHHRIPANSRVHPSAEKVRSAPRPVQVFLDAVFWAGDLYDCDTNRAAAASLAKALL